MQNLEEIKELADKICFIKEGKIKEYDYIDVLFEKYEIEDKNIGKLYEEVITNE